MDTRALKIHQKKLKRANKKYNNPIRLSNVLDNLLNTKQYNKYIETCAKHNIV